MSIRRRAVFAFRHDLFVGYYSFGAEIVIRRTVNERIQCCFKFGWSTRMDTVQYDMVWIFVCVGVREWIFRF